jgi:hypothetical protein
MADELVRGKPHDAVSAAAAIIPIGERHVIVVDGDKPRIGDRRAMGVAGEIGQYALGAAEGGLGVDDEGALPQRAHPFGERDQVAEETKFAATESGFQAVEKETAEGLRQGPDAAFIRRSAIAAPLAVWRDGAPTGAHGHVDNARALTTCPQADQNQQQTKPLAA